MTDFNLDINIGCIERLFTTRSIIACGLLTFALLKAPLQWIVMIGFVLTLVIIAKVMFLTRSPPRLPKVNASLFKSQVQPGDILLLANPNSYDLLDVLIYKIIIPFILPSGNFADHAMLVIEPTQDNTDVLVLDSTTERLMDRLANAPRQGKVIVTRLFEDKLSQYKCPVKLMWVRPKKQTNMKRFVLQHHGKPFSQMSDNTMVAKAVTPRQSWIFDWILFIKKHGVFTTEVLTIN